MKRRVLNWLVLGFLGLSAVENGLSAPLFVGQFDVANFTFDSGGGDGSVDLGSAPELITLVGNDDGGEDVTTSFLVTVMSDATFTFFWNHLTEDEPGFDPFGYYLNGVLFQLTDDSLGSQIGSTSINLVANDVFGFYTNSTDGLFGASRTEISSGSDSSVPEPATSVLFGVGIGLLYWTARHRRSAS